MSALAHFKSRTKLRNPDDIEARADRRRAHLLCMRAIGIAGALVACAGAASGWAAAGLAVYIASLVPLFVISW